MGSYTSVIDSNVKIINLEGLKQYLEKVKEGKIPNLPENLADGVEIEGDTLNFEGMVEWKIISYWYDHFVAFLRDLAVFVEGEVGLEFETHSEGGWFEFKKGECTIHTGLMKWEQYSTEEMMMDENKDDFPFTLTKELVARRL